MEKTQINNFSQYVLWAQAKDISLDDLVIVDGEKITSTDSRFLTFSQEAIQKTEEFEEIYNDNGTIIYKTHHSPYIILIMSHFLEVDTVDRRIAYSCKVKTESIPEAIQLIKTEISKYGYNVAPDIQKKNCFLPKLSKNQIISILSVILFISILVLIIAIKINYEH